MKGNDTLTGGTGRDTFVFGLDSGLDTVTDFTDTKDMIDLTALGLSGFSDLTSANALSAVPVGVILNLSVLGGNGQVTLDGVNLADLDATDFIF